MKTKLLLHFVLIFALDVSYAQPGRLDSLFGTNGIVKTSFFSQNATSYTATALQRDGKILVAGYAFNGTNNDFAVARYNNDGSLDNSFSGDGKQLTDLSNGAVHESNASSIAVQEDGKILVAGNTFNNETYNTDFAIARYKIDGSLDSTFSGDGLQTLDFGNEDILSSMSVERDGKIVVAGYTTVVAGEGFASSDFAIARYNPDGSPDKSFSGDGKQVTTFYSPEISASESVNSILIQKDGKIIVAGSVFVPVRNPDPGGDPYMFFILLFRYSSDGSLDNTFLKVDLSNYNYAKSATFQEDTKILLVTGNTVNPASFQVMRFNNDGSIDPTFSGDGKVNTDFDSVSLANSVVIQNDGKIIVGGYIKGNGNNDLALARYNSNGSTDSTFGINGKRITNDGGSEVILAMAINNNSLYAVGTGAYSSGSVGLVAAYLLDDDESNGLGVSISSPGQNASFISPAVVSLKADATDPGGDITKVEFYNGSSLIRTEYSAPYSWNWKNLPAGVYTITAKAYNENNKVVTSRPVQISVNDNTLPTVSIFEPANEQMIAGPVSIKLQAAADDFDGKITKVELYNGSTLLRTEFFLPYSWNWEEVPEGHYTIIAKAYDDKGGVTASAPVNFNVVPNAAPIVHITSPADNQIIPARSDVMIEADASDGDGSISKVEVYSGSTLLRTEYYAPFTYTWKNVSAGIYTITVKAFDNLGKATTSAPVMVQVIAANQIALHGSLPSVSTSTAKNNALNMVPVPNPVTNILHIDASQLERNLTISVTSVSGVIMKTVNSRYNNILQTDVSSLQPGVYFIKIISGNKTFESRFVKL